MNIRGVLSAIKRGGLIPYTKSVYRRKKKAYLKKKHYNSQILFINLDEPVHDNNKKLKRGKEEFIAFYDENAIYDNEYFTKLRDYLQKNPSIDFATGELQMDTGVKLAHFGKGKEVHFYDVSKKVRGAPMLIGSLYRMNIVRKNKISFNEKLKYCKPELFATQYHEVAPKGILVRTLFYQTGRKLDEKSPKMGQSHNKAWYFDTTRGYLACLIKDNKLSKIAQFGFLYLTSLRFWSNKNVNVKDVFDSKEEENEYLEEVGKGMHLIDDKMLFKKAPAIKLDRNLRRYFVMLREPENSLELEYAKVNNLGIIRFKGSSGVIIEINNLRPSVKVLDYKKCDGKGGFFIKFSLPNYFPEVDYKFHFVVENNNIKEEYEAVKTTELAAITTFFNREVLRKDTYKAFIPFEFDEGNISLNFTIEGDNYRLKLYFSDVWQSRLENNNEFKYWYYNGYIVKSCAGVLKVKKATEKDREEAENTYTAYLKDLISSEKVSEDDKNDIENAIKCREEYWKSLPRFKNKRIWIYYDKSYKAGDNGEYALKYAVRQADNIEKVFYIDTACKDGKRLINEGYKVLGSDTLEGILYALNAEIIFMTHVPPFFKLGFNKKNLPILKDLVRAKIIRMYHGFPITRSSSYTQMSNNSSAVVVATNYEKELYQNADNCFDPAQIIESGNPRYDNLYDEGYKQILIAPTWRPHLVGRTLLDGETLYNEKFIETPYYKLYSQILKSKKLRKKAREKGYKIKMFLHPKLAVQTVDFKSDSIVESLSCTEEIDYVTIMRKSSLMVTDYSSVQFDFAYMRKPVVYYQDKALPYWRVVNFDYEKNGFGEVCNTKTSLIDLLCDYIENDCKIKDIYKKRIDDFFIHSDNQSGKRLYEAALKIAEGV